MNATLEYLGIRYFEVDWLLDAGAVLIHEQMAVLVAPGEDLNRVADWVLAQVVENAAGTLLARPRDH